MEYVIPYGSWAVALGACVALWLMWQRLDEFINLVQKLADTIDDIDTDLCRSGVREYDYDRGRAGTRERFATEKALDKAIERCADVRNHRDLEKRVTDLRDQLRLMELRAEYESMEAVKDRMATIQLLKRKTDKHKAEFNMLKAVLCEWEKLAKPKYIDAGTCEVKLSWK